MEGGHAAQVMVVGVEALGRLALRALDLGLLEPRRDGPDDAGRDLVLQVEDIRHSAVEAVRPEMRAGGGVDELTGDPQAVARLANAAFQHVAHAEFAADLLYVDGAALVGEARIPRDHEELPEPRQRRNDVLDHAVGEVFLLRVARHVDEGQHGDRRLVG